MERLYEHTARRQQEQIDEQRDQIARLTALVGHLTTAQTGDRHQQVVGEVTIQAQGDNSQVQVDNRKQNLVINAFGKEGIDHLTADRVRTILDESVAYGAGATAPAASAAAAAAVLKTAMVVYSDPEHPENLTCYLPNKKTNDALVRTARSDGSIGWEVQPATLVLPGMALKSVDALFANQPYEDAGAYTPLLKELADNEVRYTSSGGAADLRPILVRNKDLLARALETLPLAGSA